jgi:hypothetical protein
VASVEQKFPDVIDIQNGQITKVPPPSELVAALSASAPIAFTLVHGVSDKELFSFADLEDLVEEEIHLRKLLHIHNRNRRVLEEQEATYMGNAVPVHIATGLQDEITHIDRVATRIKYVALLIEDLRAKQKRA